MVDHFDAFVQTAMDTMNERAPSKQEHQGASRALEILNAETMLQLGMVADACEVVVRLIRFVDNERFDLAELPRQADALRTSATELFQKEGCLTFDGVREADGHLEPASAAGDAVRRTAQNLGRRQRP